MKKKKNFLKFSLLLCACIFAVSCAGAPLNYKPTSELREDYGYVAVSEHFRAFYDFSPMGSGIMVKGVIQNISRTFASNVTLDVSDALRGQYQEKSHVIKNLGSIKMLSHKAFEFYVPSKDEKELIMAYEFMPAEEDTFVKQGQTTADTPDYFFQPIKGTIRLVLIKKDK
ncbi:hypothetical protein [Geovibrio ferrireducens]|uniref:hypothetical protein n=1 Tax=Geovibrio ferrireducens TaxID=46201 RepID=UPI002248494A|nr:hypothetical protein [Geovibrio ferrireducens]